MKTSHARLAAFVLVLTASAAAAAPSTPRVPANDPLPRRAFFGASVGPVSAGTRAHQRLADSTGVEILRILPTSTAAAIGLHAGDVITAFDGAVMPAPQVFTQAVARKKGGESVDIVYWRDGRRHAQKIRLTPMPRETSDAYAIEYGSVPSAGGRLRLVWTRPASAPAGRRFPALLIVQGIGTFTMENVPVPGGGYAAIIDDFARRGYVTLRVDKPGCGDSEGGPLRDVDFDTQLDGFRQALRVLEADPQVDPARVLVFGHSMGGVWAPLLAGEMPVRGIAVYGTFARTWLEYLLENNRRQAALAGTPAAAVDSSLWNDADATYWLDREGLAPRAAIAQRPTLRAWADSSLTQDTYYSGLHYNFVRQLAAKNLGAAWERFPGKALALWGRADFISGEEDHRLIARIVNHAHPGHGEFRVVEDSDHGFFHAKDMEQSFAQWGRPGAEFNPAIVGILHEWSERIVNPRSASTSSDKP